MPKTIRTCKWCEELERRSVAAYVVGSVGGLLVGVGYLDAFPCVEHLEHAILAGLEPDNVVTVRKVDY